MRRIRVMFGLLAAVLCAPAATAEPEQRSIFSAASLAPKDADLLVAVDDAAKIHRGPAGPAWAEIAGTALDLSRTLKAWKGLASALDLPQDEAFDALFGRRVIFCARRLKVDAADGGDKIGPPDSMAWAVLVLVEPETARRLAKRLKVAPREIVAGLPVLSVERGAFELIIKWSRRGAVVAMSPSGQRGLLDPIAAILSEQDRESLIRTKSYAAFVRRADVRSAAGLFFARVETTNGWVGAVAEADGRTLRIREVGDLGEQAPWPEPVSLRGWRALKEDAIFWLLELSPKQTAKIDTPLHTKIVAALNLPEGLEAALGGRIGAVAREAEDGDIAFGGVAEAADVQRLAPTLDGLLARLAMQMSRLSGADIHDAQPPDFGGLFPEAARRIDVYQSPAAGRLNPLRLLFGDDLELLWTYQRAPKGEGGWALVSTEKRLLEELKGAIREKADPAGRRRWVSVASARPRAFIELLRRRGVPIFDPFAAARWIERASWASWTPAPGLIEGRMVIEFAAGEAE